MLIIIGLVGTYTCAVILLHFCLLLLTAADTAELKIQS